MSLTENSNDMIMCVWERTRIQGRIRYVVKSWIVPFGIILPIIVSFVTCLITMHDKVSGLKAAAIFIAIFDPVFIAVAFFAGRYTWEDCEKQYHLWKKEFKTPITSESASRSKFDRFFLLILSIYSLPIFWITIIAFLTLPFLIPGIILRVIGFWTFSVACGFVFICSFVLLSRGMFAMKNPICGHTLLTFTGPHKHPDANTNYVKNAWSVFRGRPFTCLECAGRYIFERTSNQVQIVKLDGHEGRKVSARQKNC